MYRALRTFRRNFTCTSVGLLCLTLLTFGAVAEVQSHEGMTMTDAARYTCQSMMPASVFTCGSPVATTRNNQPVFLLQ